MITKSIAQLQIELADAERANAVLKARAEKAQANLDYVAMMTDVEIPTEEEERDAQ